MLDAEYNLFAHLGNLLSTLQVFPKLRSVLCDYRISLLDKSIKLSTARCNQMISDIETMRKSN